MRRLSQSLKEQNWTAITVEFVLLIVGVFLGIQAANWNEARSDRVAYEAALTRLVAEIDTNLAYLDASDAASLLSRAQQFGHVDAASRLSSTQGASHHGKDFG